MTVSFSKEELDYILIRVLKGTEFESIPQIIENGAIIQPGLLTFTLKIGPLTVRAEATAKAIDGEIELDIGKVTGNLFGLARKYVEDQIISRLKPFSKFVVCYQAKNGNLRFGNGALKVTDLELREDLVFLEVAS